MKKISLFLIVLISVFVLVACGPEEFTVTFNSDGGSYVSSQIVIEGETLKILEEPIKSGYEFVYWTLNEEEFLIETKIMSNLELIARWKVIEQKLETYQVTFDTDGGTNIETQAILEGNLVTKPNAPTKENHTFLYWALNEIEFNFATPVTRNITLKAIWQLDEVEKETYQVTFDTDGGSNVEPLNVVEGNQITKPNDPIKDNYTFMYWTLNGLEFDFKTLITSDLELVAKWEEVTPREEVTITFVLNNNEPNIVETALEGDNVSFPNISYPGHQIVTWYLDESFEMPFDINEELVSDLTLYAKWAAETKVQMKFDDAVWRNQMSDGGFNNASRVGLEPSYFIIESKKGTTNNNVGVYGELRFYAGSQIEISMHEAFIIRGIRLIGGSPDIKVLINNQVVNNPGNINTSTVTIKNTRSSGTIAVSNIEITYYQVGVPPIKEDDINRPTFDVSEYELTIKDVGETFEHPTFKALDVEDGEIDGIIDPNKSIMPNPHVPGIYYIVYYAIDSEDNRGQAHITIIYREVNSLDTYYGEFIDNNGETLINSLRNVTKNLNNLDYDFARVALGEIDRDLNNFDNVLLIYNRGSVNGTWDGGTTWNREHVWPQSYLAHASDSDLHNLRAASTSVNSSRGNRNYTNGSGKYTTVGTSSWYPGDEDKGDVARIIFYMIVTWDLNPREDIDMLIDWHLEDPVDNFEIIRNEVIFKYQDNRNPFIDFPELVERAFGN